MGANDHKISFEEEFVDGSNNIMVKKVSMHPPEIRGLFGTKGDSTDWLNAVSGFPNGVPRFQSKQEALDFISEYKRNHGGSNPDHPHLQHIFTTLIGWEQIEKLLIPAIEKARTEPTSAPTVPRDYGKTTSASSSNVYERPDCKAVMDAIAERLDVPFHRCLSVNSTLNTLKYLYHHMKFGIFVMVHDRALRIFAPFVNVDYRNTWSDHLRIEGDGTLETYYSEKSGRYREEKIDLDRSKWWANGNIMCNEATKEEDKSKSQHWGDHFLAPLRDMLAEACRERKLPDCEFFLNKRDYPQIKVNVERGVPVEPYGFIFDKDDRDPEQDVDLFAEHRFLTYAPVVSFYATAPNRFTDIPFPSSEDWEAACGLVFPNSFEDGKAKPRDLFTEENFRKFERSWDDGRVATAFFRGTATGGGTKVENNQRLKVAYLSDKWKDDPVRGGAEPYLDAAIVGWNNSPMTFLRSDEFNFTAGQHHFTPIYEQSKYKYLVYVDGHCAACRYGFMMRLGSVILKVAPRQVADRMWYFDLLKPYHDHVPVKADLSDLEEKILWCRENDDKCREIGQHAKEFYEKYVARSALLDYIEMVSKNIARRFYKPPSWWEPPPPAQKPPQLRKPDAPCYEDRKDPENNRLCTRCHEEKEAEEQELEQDMAKKRDELKKKDMSKKRRRERLKERANKKPTK